MWGPAAADLDIHAAASLLGLRANPVYVKLPHSSVPLGLDDPRVAQFFSQNPTIRKGAVMFVSQIAGLTQEDMFNMAEGAVGCPPSIPASLAVPAHFQLHHLVTRFDPKDKRAGGQVGQAHVTPNARSSASDNILASTRKNSAYLLTAMGSPWAESDIFCP